MKKNAILKGNWQKKLPDPAMPIRHLTLILFLLLFGVPLSAQETFNLSYEKTPVREVLKAIEQQSSYSFIYNSRLVNVEQEVSVNIKTVDISALLTKILDGTDISYSIIEKQIVLSDNRGSLKKQTPIAIAGTITDDNALPLIGVSVLEKGTTNGTVTDADGHYRILVSGENSIIQFSFIGFSTVERLVGAQKEINHQMEPSFENLSEVVVIGYGSIRKKDMTGSIASVTTAGLESLPLPNIGDALQGRAAGMQVISSGIPGDEPSFIIRGLSSINDSDPLFVIDGLPVSSGISTLNPNDIESIQILKDASSAAIYGSRGANGVIIITTKRGRNEKDRLNIDYFHSFQQPVNTIEMLNASEYAAYSNDMLSNAGEVTNPLWADPSTIGKGTDWLDALFRTASLQSISLSYSNSNEKSNMHVSVNYLNQEGIVIKTGYERYTVQFNSDNRIFDWLKFGNNLTLNHDVRKSGDYNIKNTMGSLPVQTIWDADGEFSNQDSSNPLWYGGIDNPIGLASLIKNSTKGYNLIGSIFSELNILKDIRFKTNFGLQLNSWDDCTWRPEHDWPASPQTSSSLYQRNNKSITWLWDNTLTYNKIFYALHAVNLMLGISAQENYSEWIAGYRDGFSSDDTQVLNAGGVDNINATGSNSDWALFSYFGRVNYSYNDKYLLTATIRRDGSSRFGPKNRFGTFPSASVAWRISKEDFFPVTNFINEIKLRIGYGETGNQEIGSNYPYASSLTVASTTFNNLFVPMVYPRALPNSSIHWEAVQQTNAGLNIALFNNRVEASIDGFVKNTTGMLVRGVVLTTSGFDNEDENNRPYVNAGEMRNVGLELNVETQNFTKGKFKWNTMVNLTYMKNRIENLYDTIPITTGNIDGNINLYAARHMKGHPSNAFFGYITDGIFQTQDEVNNSSQQVAGATSAGDIRFKDINNDGVISDNDRTFIGNPNPKLIFSINNTFRYQGIDLSLFFQGSYGNDIFNANRLQTEGMDAARNQSKEVLHRWTGQGTSNSMPRAVYGDPANNNRISDRYVEDGSFLRLKTLTLGYTLPERYVGQISASSLRIYMTAQNLLTFTNYSGIDPEVGITGIDNNLYPVTRTFSFGFNLSF